jgi:hypothetical protein
MQPDLIPNQSHPGRSEAESRDLLGSNCAEEIPDKPLRGFPG